MSSRQQACSTALDRPKAGTGRCSKLVEMIGISWFRRRVMARRVIILVSRRESGDPEDLQLQNGLDSRLRGNDSCRILLSTFYESIKIYFGHFSPVVILSAFSTILSSRKRPALLRLFIAWAADSIRPFLLALKTSPSVPITETPSARAHDLASASSRTATPEPACNTPAITDDSPGPRLHSNTSSGIVPATSRFPHPACMTSLAGSDTGPAKISLATASGTMTSTPGSSRMASRPAFARPL